MGLTSKGELLAIVGGSISHIPFIKAAKKLGYRTVVFDQNPEAPGGKIADQFFSISTHDLDGLRKVCITQPLTGIVTYSAYEGALRAVAMIAEELGLPSFSDQAVSLCNDKFKMKAAFKRAEIPTPDWCVTSSPAEGEAFVKDHAPMILKPARGSRGSLGVTVVNDTMKLVEDFESVKAYSHDGNVVIEELLDGKEYSVDGVIYDQDVHVFSVSEKFNLGQERNFIMSGFALGKSPDQNDKLQSSLIAEPVINALKALGINNTFFGSDVLVADGGPVLLEIGLLMDAKMDRLLCFTGMDVYSIRCQMAVGKDIQDIRRDFNFGYALDFLFADKSGMLAIPNDLPITKAGDREWTIEWERKIGDHVQPPSSIADVVGWVLVRDKDRETACQLSRSIASSNLFNIME